MTSKNMSKSMLVGVIGSGSFGTALSNLLAENCEVLLYTRREEVKERILETRENAGQKIAGNIIPTTDLEEVATKCALLFPTVPSANFRDMMRDLSPFLEPDHLLIHATKGLDLQLPEGSRLENTRVDREMVRTMSEVIQEESIAVRVGCLAGPNLARELAAGQPAATVIASHFDEVIKAGRAALRSNRFQVYGNHDLTGVELSGVLKNAIAIGSGALSGLGLGENARALLITKGLSEMIRLGSALGSDTTAFFGLAGIGDLIATCNSALSRNFSVGNRLAKGESLEEILESVTEVAEGVNTIRITKKLGEHYDVRTPIINTLYEVLFGKMTAHQALHHLMSHPFSVDVDFL